MRDDELGHIGACGKELARDAGIPREQIAKGKSIFGDMGMEVSHFGAIWHIHKIAQLMDTDLNRISRKYGLSLADFHLLSAIMMENPDPAMATQLATVLNVSAAALSVRIAKLSELGLLVQEDAPEDRRAKYLRLTQMGADKVAAIGADIEINGRFVHHYRQMAESDRDGLDQILAHLHTMMNRDFRAVTR